MNENLPDVSKYEKELELFIKKNPGLDIPTPHLLNEISKGHDYHFVGKVGSFCPIKPNRGGGVLLREKDGKYYAATGSKGYRWLEAEMVKVLKKEDDIDTNYYRGLVDDALDNMKKYGDVEWFISDNPTDTPPWMMPCGLYESCMECPNWTKNEGKINSCKLGYDCMPF
jgi:hypothetical protein